MKEIVLKVDGMSCTGCENRIKNVLEDMEEIEKVVASHLKKEVKVVCQKELDLNIIKEKIEDLGFKVL